MPTIFLSPSTQEYNQYVTGAGSEEYFMNLLADAMEPLLLSNGIQFTRNDPRGTVSDSIRQSNAGSYDFHLALHSNASGPGQRGPEPGYCRLLLSRQRKQPAGGGAVCIGPARDLSPAKSGDHPLHNHSCRGETHQGPCRAAGDRLPR